MQLRKDGTRTRRRKMENNERFLEKRATTKGIPPLAVRKKKFKAQRLARRIRRLHDNS